MGKIDISGSKIIVTGGNGYLGSRLIDKLLLEHYNVVSIDLQNKPLNNNVHYYQVDLTNKEEVNDVVSAINPDFIYHLAASLDRTRDFENAPKIYEINLFGTINLLNALKDVDYKKFIYTGTSEIYGGDKIRIPFKEVDDFVPASPYSLSKFSAEMVIRSFSKLNNKRFTILRLFNFYGEGMKTLFFLPQLIEKIKRGEDFDMTKGEQVRDFVPVDDVLNILLLVLINNDSDNEVFNVCSGKGISLQEIALKLKRYFGSKSNINFGAIPYRENEVWEMVGDNSKIKRKLNVTINSLFNNFENFNVLG